MYIVLDISSLFSQKGERVYGPFENYDQAEVKANKLRENYIRGTRTTNSDVMGYYHTDEEARKGSHCHIKVLPLLAP